MRLIVAVAASLALGCAGFGNAEAGYAHAIAKSPEQAAVAINAQAGIGDRVNDTTGTGFGAMLRGKFGSNVQQVALGPLGFLGTKLGDANAPLALVAFGGVHIFQLDNVHTSSGDSFSFGALSPVGELLLFIDPAQLTVGVSGEYDLRFSSVPNTGYVSFTVGYGGFDVTKARAMPMPR